jgi:hypothetical protein
VGEQQERGLNQAREQGQDQRSPDHHDRQRLLRVRADPARQRRRRQPEHRHEGGHEHRAEPPLGCVPHPFFAGATREGRAAGYTATSRERQLAGEVDLTF